MGRSVTSELTSIQDIHELIRQGFVYTVFSQFCLYVILGQIGLRDTQLIAQIAPQRTQYLVVEFFLLVLFHQLAGVLQTSNRHLVRLLGTNQGDVGVFLHLLTINKEEYDKQDSRYDIAKIIHKGTEENTITSLDKGEAFRL